MEVFALLDSKKVLVEDGVWRGYFVVDGIAYRRTLGPAESMTAVEADAALDPYIDCARVERVDDVTFWELAEEWRAVHLVKLSKRRQQWQTSLLRRFVYPAVGARMVKSLSAPELLRAVQPIEAAGYTAASHECLQMIGEILRYGARTKRSADLTVGQHAYLERHLARHMPALLDRRSLGELMRYLTSLDDPVVRARLLLQAYCATRSGETTSARWRDVDMRAALWTLPNAATKMKRTHYVPLAPQAVKLLRGLRDITGGGAFLFPASRKRGAPMSAGVAVDALRKKYPSDTMSLHGLRSAFTSISVDRGWDKKIVNRQLGHKEKDKVWDAYYSTGYLSQRRALMRDWADWLDAARDGTRCKRRR